MSNFPATISKLQSEVCDLGFDLDDARAWADVMARMLELADKGKRPPSSVAMDLVRKFRRGEEYVNTGRIRTEAEVPQ